MNIYLGRFYWWVSQNLLYTTYINTFFNQICSEWMPEHMGCNLCFNSGLFRVFSQHKANRLFCVSVASFIHKKIPTLFYFLFIFYIIFPQNFQNCIITDLNISLFSSFPHNSYQSRIQIYALISDIWNLVYSRAGGKKQLYNRCITQTMFISNWEAARSLLWG